LVESNNNPFLEDALPRNAPPAPPLPLNEPPENEPGAPLEEDAAAGGFVNLFKFLPNFFFVAAPPPIPGAAPTTPPLTAGLPPPELSEGIFLG